MARPVDLDRLLSSLNTSGLQQRDNALYQVIQNLIKFGQQFQNFSATQINTIFPSGVLPVASGGTGNSSFIEGSVIFASGSGASSQLNEDNANFFWDDTNNRLGILTNVPDKSLTLGTAGIFGWLGRTRLASASNGTLLLTNSANTSGVTLNVVAQDTVLELFARDGASSGYLRAFGIEARPTGYIGFQGLAVIQSPADGKILLTRQAGTNFDSLMFGGTSSSFPALERSSTILRVRLADSSAYAPLESLNVRTGLGSAAAPAYSFITLTDTGMYSVSSVLGFTVAGTLRWFIDTNGHLRLNSNSAQDVGEQGGSIRTFYGTQYGHIDGVTAPGNVSGFAFTYVDTADGDYKIKFGDNVVRTIAVDVAPPTYSITNVTTDRAYDANATTLDEIADTLGTLIDDLRNQNILT